MKQIFPLIGAIVLSATSNLMLAQQAKPHQTLIEKMISKKQLRLGWYTKPNNHQVKSKTTGNNFYRPKAIGVQQYDFIPMAFNPTDSQEIYWNNGYGENENMISNYNNTFYYKNGLVIDFNRMEMLINQNFEHLDFVYFPRTDSILTYNGGNFDENFKSYISNDKIDSVEITNQQVKIYYEYDANNNIKKQTVMNNNVIYLLDTATYSATNKKLTHYKKEDDGTDIYEYINVFVYDANDKLVISYYEEYYNNVLDYGTMDSTFVVSANKDSVVLYMDNSGTYDIYGTKEIFYNNGLADSFYFNDVISLEQQKYYLTRNANNLITNYTYKGTDSFKLMIDYTANDLVASCSGIYYQGGNTYPFGKEVYTYDANENLIKYEDFTGYNDVTNTWFLQDQDRLVNIYYELYSDEPCELLMSYKRLDPNDTLCADIELDFENEDLPITITVASLNTPSVVNYTITSLPFVLENMCPEKYKIFANDLKNCKDTLEFEIQDLTSVHNIDFANTISVYPNPASDVVHIDGLTVGAQLSLIDMFGRTLQTAAIKNSNHQLNIATLPNGIYTIQINLNGTIANKKLVISK